MRELWRGEAAFSECDALGLPFDLIVGKASEALDALASELGLGSFESPRATSALMVREIRFKRLGSIASGSAIVITGGVERFEATSLLARLELRSVEEDQPAATIAILADHIETEHAKLFPWTSRTVKAAEGLRVRPAAEDKNGAAPTKPAAMLGEATGQGVFQFGDADAFGRVRVASVLRRVLESGNWPFATPADAAGPQPAHLDGRLRVHAYPAPGDRYVVMSDVAEADGGRWRETRVLWAPTGLAIWAQLDLSGAWLDPATGNPVDPPAHAVNTPA